MNEKDFFFSRATLVWSPILLVTIFRCVLPLHKLRERNVLQAVYSIVKCLYDRAKCLVTKPSVISEEKKHLSSVHVSNGSAPPPLFRRLETQEQPPGKSPWQTSNPPPFYPTYREYRSLFKSEKTFRSHLVRPKDTVDPAKRDGVVYRIPCEYGKVHIGETGRSMYERIKEHDRDRRLVLTQDLRRF